MRTVGTPAGSSLLLGRAELRRVMALGASTPEQRAERGQFFTPAPVAELMASLVDIGRLPATVHLLDPGAGVGSLTAAAVARLIAEDSRRSLAVAAYELDPGLLDDLRATLAECAAAARAAGLPASFQAHTQDYVQAAIAALDPGLFDASGPTGGRGSSDAGYDLVVMNPPYRKIHTLSRERRLLARVGIEVSNLYTAFLSLAVRQLRPGGQLVAITPRSFCNGPYFRRFRRSFLEQMALRRIHLFESRHSTFRDADVLQENIIFAAVKHGTPAAVVISGSIDVSDAEYVHREVPYDRVVDPADPEQVIRVSADAASSQASDLVRGVAGDLHQLQLMVSTGRVVDFRSREHLRAEPGPSTVPLIYPSHIADGFVTWPRPNGRKPNAVMDVPATRPLLLPNETYVLVKRFTSKEEPRRLVAAVHDPALVPAALVGFENHLNVYHRDGRGLDPRLARGLALYLNSSVVDIHFRQFSGHTQVNATDLRNLRYPLPEQLERLGAAIDGTMPDQRTVDRLVHLHVSELDPNWGGIDPVSIRDKINEAQDILKQLGFPWSQRNERSALTLLALLGLRPEDPWVAATDPLVGITQMMEWFADHYGRRYAPNTRETVRRRTVHQFVDAGLVTRNPDKPTRPTNSGKTVYQVERSALALLRAYGTGEWLDGLAAYQASQESLRRLYAAERRMQRIPVTLANGDQFTLSPGGQNVLVKKVLDEFCPRFAPGGHVLYVGDTDDKFIVYDREGLAELDVVIDQHGKMPDIVVHHAAKGWLLLIEAVTSHGPVTPKRHHDLRRLFASSKVPLVFVTAFLTRKAAARFLSEISWETEVWFAEVPEHMIHFNGARFLGPYPS
jgi:adenine-specific DNA-methyltransferase